MAVARIRQLGRPAAILAAVFLVIVVAFVAFRGWDRYVEDRLARWAVDEVARRTGGVYRLTLGDLSFLPLAGSISIDSAVVSTDTARNRRRETPLPALDWRAHGCSVAGLDAVRLLLRKSFVARGLGCDRVAAAITLPHPDKDRRTPDSTSTAPDSVPSDPDSAADPLEELVRPLGLSSFQVADVSLPALSFRIERPGRRGPSSVRLQHARFEGKNLVLDPTATLGKQRVLSADRARLTATGVLMQPDTLVEFAAEGLEAELTDSTLRLAGVRHEPTIPEEEWVRRVRVRRDRISFELDTLRAWGVAYRAFVATGDIGVRTLELDGARLDVLSDRRIPPGRPSRHRTPQQKAADPGPALRLDTILVSRGTITYRERKPERSRPGVVSFDSVQATILHLHLPAREEPLRIETRARLMNAGVLTMEATVPLGAPDFRYRLSGRLGPMPASAFNRFLSVNEPFELERGWIERVTFRQTATRGLAVTTLTPRYRDFSVEPTGDGGGIIGSVVREVKELIADAFVVRSRNPEEDGQNLRTARTARRYDPRNTWIQFLWLSVRDAVMEAMKE